MICFLDLTSFGLPIGPIFNRQLSPYDGERKGGRQGRHVGRE